MNILNFHGRTALGNLKVSAIRLLHIEMIALGDLDALVTLADTHSTALVVVEIS